MKAKANGHSRHIPLGGSGYHGPTMVLLKEEDLKALVEAMEEAEELLGEYCQHWEGAPAPSEIRTKNLHGKLCELLRTTPAKK